MCLCVCVSSNNLPLSLQGGVVIVSHDQHLIEACAQEVWLCQGRTVQRLEGGLRQYRTALEAEFASVRTT